MMPQVRRYFAPYDEASSQIMGRGRALLVGEVQLAGSGLDAADAAPAGDRPDLTVRDGPVGVEDDAALPLGLRLAIQVRVYGKAGLAQAL